MSQIVLTDAEPQTRVKVLAKCPQHPGAQVLVANIQETHGVCAKCGYEPLELPR